MLTEDQQHKIRQRLQHYPGLYYYKNKTLARATEGSKMDGIEVRNYIHHK